MGPGLPLNRVLKGSRKALVHRGNPCQKSRLCYNGIRKSRERGHVMENMELLQAMRQMMEEVVSPIYERLDKMDERFDKMDERLDGIESHLEKVETLATKTQITLENDIKPKINLLFEGQITLQNRFSQLDRMEEMLRELRYDVQDLQHIVSWHSNDIRWLKRRRYSNKI